MSWSFGLTTGVLLGDWESVPVFPLCSNSLAIDDVEGGITSEDKSKLVTKIYHIEIVKRFHAYNIDITHLYPLLEGCSYYQVLTTDQAQAVVHLFHLRMVCLLPDKKSIQLVTVEGCQ